MNRIKSPWLVYLVIIFCIFPLELQAQFAPLRRTVSPQQPMYLVHIDTWNWPDPQKFIDMVPPDVKPYVVFTLSLSINHDSNTGKWGTVEYGYETAKSWLRTCAENRVWAMIQPSSGGFSHFSDFDLSTYEEFFRQYPNFLGFNYCEQFWGFDDKYSVTWLQRVAHWANLMKLNQKYGGYLVVSWCGNQWDANLNPVAMFKRNPDFAAICKQSPENLILCEKYTQGGFQNDMESVSLGAYLSGFSGNYGIRYDETGWSVGSAGTKFVMASGGAPYLEHIMLTGETVMDGPETIPLQTSREIGTATTADGYTKRQWEFYPQFYNVTLDILRKILDGMVRIPTRQEVIDRTKVVILNDATTGTDLNMYSSPENLFEGLYKMPGYGNWTADTSFYKKTGRYPTIPTVFQLTDNLANSFSVKINKSSMAARWPVISSKVTELNGIFPSEYTGDIYAGRHENGWVIYNPYKTGQRAKGSIPFKYNTSDHVDLSMSLFSAGVMKEYSDSLKFYITNYNDKNGTQKLDTIKIYGATSQPTFIVKDRLVKRIASDTQCNVTSSWENGVFSLYLSYNGPLDISVKCSGTANGRLTNYTQAIIAQPTQPSVYTGPRQYEAEVFEYKDITRNYTNGINSGIANYTGQGFINFGASATAGIRKIVHVPISGLYRLDTKYANIQSIVSTIDLYVNDVKIATPTLAKTASFSTWAVNSQYIMLNAGYNTIALKANAAATSSNILIDNMVLVRAVGENIYDFSNDQTSTVAQLPAAELVTIKGGSGGVVSYTAIDNSVTNAFKSYSVGNVNATGVADLVMFPTDATNYSVIWKEYYGTTGAKKGILLRANTLASSYADGLKQGYLFISQNNNDNTVSLKSYVVGANNITEKTSFTTNFTIQTGKPCWYRASAVGNKLLFECSSDSINWIGGTGTSFTDNSYTVGSSQLVWGLNSGVTDWVMDNICYKSGTISPSLVSLKGFSYEHSKGPSANQVFTVSGVSLSNNLIITAPDNFEVSTNSGSGYSSSIVLNNTGGSVSGTSVYVRLKAGLGVNTYSGTLVISSEGVQNSTISLTGGVTPLNISKSYDFSADVATTSPSTPPAVNTNISSDNGATAGVVNYTDSNNKASNMLRPYSGGNRNSTGAVDLSLFSPTSTDYSVTWKQCVNSGKDYKVGVLLRGDASKRGDATTGYVGGLMQGYLFIAYSKTSGGSEFRIYKSTSATTLSMLVNTSVSTLSPTTGQPIWYRASATGGSSALLKIMYSTDSITWNAGATYTDTSLTPYLAGSTQFVWGLGVNNTDFYVDNITFLGIEDSGVTGIDVPVMTDADATVVSSEYYTITGQKVANFRSNLKGLYIIRSVLSNGKVRICKVHYR